MSTVTVAGVSVGDLLGQRMDCREACARVLRRMGRAVGDDAFDSTADLWDAVTDAPRAGDVIVSRPNGRLHVAVILSTRPGRGLAFTSDVGAGARPVSLTAAMVDRVGVYRLKSGESHS